MPNYAPTTWANGDLITSTKLNNIENGLNNLTIAGTANQVLVNGATTALNNVAITLTLPQSIATGSSPTFTGLTLSGTALDVGGVSGSFSQLSNITGNSAGATTTALLLQNKATQAVNAGVALRFGGATDWFGGIDAVFDASLGGYLKLSTQTGGTLYERVRIDAAGRVGFGVTPPAWHADFKAVHVGSVAALSSWTAASAGAPTRLSANTYHDGSNYLRIIADEASLYEQKDGAHIWYVAASSTAGSTISFTTAMTINNSADIYYGTESAANKIAKESIALAFALIM